MPLPRFKWEEQTTESLAPYEDHYWGLADCEEYMHHEPEDAILYGLDDMAPTPISELPAEIVIEGCKKLEGKDAEGVYCAPHLEPCEPVVQFTVDVQRWIRENQPQWLEEESAKK